MKLGLVLAGGGARGAFQIGVWKALKELGIDKYIQAISGTSIGALNGALFVQGDLGIAEQLWLSISREKILPIDNRSLITKGIIMAIGSRNINLIKKYIPRTLEQGNVSRGGLIEMLDEYLDFSHIRQSSISFYAACSEMPSLKAKYFRLNNYVEEEIKDILLATSALPMIYESEEIETKKYLDGGMSDNVPIQPLYGEGCDIILVVHLSKQQEIDRSKFPNTKIIEIMPSEIDESVLSGTLGFDSDDVRKRIKIGYDDAKNLLEPIMELARFQMMRAPQQAVSSFGKSLVANSSKFFCRMVSPDKQKIEVDENTEKESM